MAVTGSCGGLTELWTRYAGVYPDIPWIARHSFGNDAAALGKDPRFCCGSNAPF
jgi:hypothetical protein